MSQTVKTIVFIVVAGVSAITAYVTRPRPQAARLTVDINRPLFEKYEDPEEAARIRIVRIDEQLGQFIEFVLERDPETKLWRVPSEYNYPADQEDRIRDALTALVGLTPIDKVAEKTSDHELLGVVEPKSDLEVSQQGTGTLVIVEDRSDNVLAKLIIGKEGRSKKDSATGPQDEERLFFVRKPAEDVVYIAKLKPDVFSTDFKDWIHKNLLKIDSFDVEGLTFLNYSVPYDEERTAQGTRIRPRLESINHKMDVDLRWDNRQARWELKRFVTYADGRPIDTKLAETEELNSLKLDDIKRAVAQLELVGVRPLPEGLDADLREGREFQNNREYLQSLMRRGFFPRADGNQIGLVSENGEMVVSTRDGVQYVL
ncbi:MAG TPA: DUF4340 domain-containing protein, partial [Planctomycetaceae bacterium]|nr:DUF4340 domain-containing protein [Planctomycetaceae bacterium]